MGLSDLFLFQTLQNLSRAFLPSRTKLFFSVHNTFLMMSAQTVMEFALFGKTDRLLSGQLLTVLPKFTLSPLMKASKQAFSICL